MLSASDQREIRRKMCFHLMCGATECNKDLPIKSRLRAITHEFKLKYTNSNCLQRSFTHREAGGGTDGVKPDVRAGRGELGGH